MAIKFKLKVKKTTNSNDGLLFGDFLLFLVRIVQKNAEFLKNVHVRGKFLSSTDAKFVLENIGKSYIG